MRPSFNVTKEPSELRGCSLVGSMLKTVSAATMNLQTKGKSRISILELMGTSTRARAKRLPPSRHDPPYHLSMHIRQAAVDPIVSDGELGVLDAEEIQDGRVNIINLGGM